VRPRQCRFVAFVDAVKTFRGADHALFVAPTTGQPFRWPQLFAGYIETLIDWINIAGTALEPAPNSESG
jgi:hypothetical protein